MVVITNVLADDHGCRMTFTSPTIGKLFSNIIRTKPTAQENYEECVEDGEFLLRKYPNNSYTCVRE